MGTSCIMDKGMLQLWEWDDFVVQTGQLTELQTFQVGSAPAQVFVFEDCLTHLAHQGGNKQVAINQNVYHLQLWMC